ncbi:MAG TPA: LPS export ABC transporter periplasmic protein LptC [Burkholderiales bacterium]|nr:LPS export ABC transporter periplasmic protein LptC [Burkholderiales bacterium]
MIGERLSAWFPLLLLGALAGLTFWLDRAVQLPEAAGNALRHDPDYIVNQLSAVQMGADGRTKSTLTANKMLHYPDDDSTMLTMPRWVSYEADAPPLTVTSLEGMVSSNGENIYFRDNVRVVRAAHGEHSELVLETSLLHVIPNRNIAQTDRPVRITDANTVVNAIGLELNSETHVLKLLSQVKGTYYEAGKAAKTHSPR